MCSQLESLRGDLDSSRAQVSEALSSLESCQGELATCRGQATQLGQELGVAKEQGAQLTKDKESQQELIGKVSQCPQVHTSLGICSGATVSLDSRFGVHALIKSKYCWYLHAVYLSNPADWPAIPLRPCRVS